MVEKFEGEDKVLEGEDPKPQQEVKLDSDCRDTYEEEQIKLDGLKRLEEWEPSDPLRNKDFMFS